MQAKVLDKYSMRYSELMEETLDRLARYVQNNGYLSSEYVIGLSRQYPYDGGDLYRGLHFDTQEQYDSFLGKIANGEFTTASTTSWTKDQQTAKSFSLMKMTYVPDLAIMKADAARHEVGDHMPGFEGIVIKTTVPQGTGLDVTKTKIGAESEVILPPGTYPIEIVDRSIPYLRQFDELEKVKNLMRNVIDQNDRGDKLTYILQSWFPKLDDNSKTELADWMHSELLNDVDGDMLYFKKKEWRGQTEVDLAVDMFLDKRVSDWISPKGKEKLKRVARNTTKKVNKIISELSDEELLNLRFQGSVPLKMLNPNYSQDMKGAAKRIAQVYHTMNKSRPIDRDELHSLAKKFQNVLELLSMTV